MQVVNVSAQTRDTVGKSANKKTRKEGLIPGVLYGSSDSIKLAVTHNEIKSLIYTPDFKLANLEVGGKSVKCFVKDVQFHPVTDNIVHVDFLELTDGKMVKVDIPVRFKGVSPGVIEGGKLTVQRRKVTIKTTPENLVDEVYADISQLELGNSVRVSELEISDKIEMMTPGSIPVGIVEVPRALKSADAEAEEMAAVEGAEGAAEGGDAPAE